MMNMSDRRLVLMVALVGLAPVGAIADEYEYYRGAQFPGKDAIALTRSQEGVVSLFQHKKCPTPPRRGVFAVYDYRPTQDFP